MKKYLVLIFLMNSIFGAPETAGIKIQVLLQTVESTIDSLLKKIDAFAETEVDRIKAEFDSFRRLLESLNNCTQDNCPKTPQALAVLADSSIKKIEQIKKEHTLKSDLSAQAANLIDAFSFYKNNIFKPYTKGENFQTYMDYLKDYVDNFQKKIGTKFSRVKLPEFIINEINKFQEQFFINSQENISSLMSQMDTVRNKLGLSEVYIEDKLKVFDKSKDTIDSYSLYLEKYMDDYKKRIADNKMKPKVPAYIFFDIQDKADFFERQLQEIQSPVNVKLKAKQVLSGLRKFFALHEFKPAPLTPKPVEIKEKLPPTAQEKELAKVDFATLPVAAASKKLNEFTGTFNHLSIKQLLDIAKSEDVMENLDTDTFDKLKAAAKDNLDMAEDQQRIVLAQKYRIKNN